MEFNHISVLLYETIDSINVKKNGIYVDGTMGGGGHSSEILSRLKMGGRLIGIDQDDDAIGECKKRFKDNKNMTIVKDNFKNIKSILNDLNLDGIDGMILDLGVSSYQLDEEGRGFSYMKNAPLDMRMDRSSGLTAYDVVNTYSKEHLSEIFYNYGEEKWAKRIADIIIEKRNESKVETTLELVDIVKRAVPKGARDEGHPAKRVFQAIRIEVNNELGILKNAINDAFNSLNSGGRLSIISFHSLEDRIVKSTFNNLSVVCTCPKEFPICVCGGVKKATVITRKPILPSDDELAINARSKSAKLRAIEKI